MALIATTKFGGSASCGVVAIVLPVGATMLFPPGAVAAGGTKAACVKWGDTAPGKLTRGQARKAILCLLNAERGDAGLKPLERNRKLQDAAQKHNDEMVGSGCFEHECPGEDALGDRLDEIGYFVGGLSEWAFGENIAWGLAERGDAEPHHGRVDAQQRPSGQHPQS